MMEVLKMVPLIRTKLSKCYFSRTYVHTNLKPPKANQTLKRYVNSNCNTKAVIFFRELLRQNPSSIDSFSFLFVLKACTRKSCLLEGKELHAQLIKSGFHSIIHLQAVLVSFYSGAGNLLDARRVFDEIPKKNVVSWTTLISAYVVNQKPRKALELFREMQMLNVEADLVTLTVALSACADLGALEMGEWIHAYVRRKPELEADLNLNNAFINMYAKCGKIQTARKLFDSLGEKDVTTWTSMIVGHALHGQASEALELFTRDVHFGCMVDLFCRAGLLKEAYDFVIEMPGQANAVIWRTLLGACNINAEIELGEKVKLKLLELEPGYVGDSVAMSNIYAAKGVWDKKVKVRDQIKQLRRAPGCSSIEVASEISEFVSGDDDHPLKAEIYEALEYLTVSMKTYYHSLQISSLP